MDAGPRQRSARRDHGRDARRDRGRRRASRRAWPTLAAGLIWLDRPAVAARRARGASPAGRGRQPDAGRSGGRTAGSIPAVRRPSSSARCGRSRAGPAASSRRAPAASSCSGRSVGPRSAGAPGSIVRDGAGARPGHRRRPACELERGPARRRPADDRRRPAPRPCPGLVARSDRSDRRPGDNRADDARSRPGLSGLPPSELAAWFAGRGEPRLPRPPGRRRPVGRGSDLGRIDRDPARRASGPSSMRRSASTRSPIRRSAWPTAA